MLRWVQTIATTDEEIGPRQAVVHQVMQGYAKRFRCSAGVAQAIKTNDSPAYQEALRALGDGAVRDMRIVEGVT